MAINKPEQASTEMTKVLKSIADTIDGKSNTDCAATSEISKWTKYVGNKLAENSGSGGGSGTEIIYLLYSGGADSLATTDYTDVSKAKLLEYLADESKIVVINNSVVTRIVSNGLLESANCDMTRIYYFNDKTRIQNYNMTVQNSTVTFTNIQVMIDSNNSVTTSTNTYELL